MPRRLDHRTVSPDAVKALLDLTAKVAALIPDGQLRNMVDLRVSQLNGCAYCIDMHSKDMRASGESEDRVYMLSAWRESPLYDARERAALAWAEAVTRLSDDGVTDDVYEQARQQFSEKELVDLTLAVIAINGWNRLNIPFKTEPGGYKPVVRTHAATGA